MPKSVRTKSIVCGIHWTNLPCTKDLAHEGFGKKYQSLWGAPDDKSALKKEDDLPPAAKGGEGNLSR
eukprot:1169724-Prymnesium_polylepis.1